MAVTCRSSLELSPGERWFAVHTQPKREPAAKQNLELQQFRAFLPLINKTVRHARRVISSKAALFPRYMFVIMDLERDQWRSVNGTFGVAGLVMEYDRPKPVPVGIVETLTATTSDAGLFEPDEILSSGDKVRILSGPFADQLGRVSALKGQERVFVLLEAMGMTPKLELPRKQVLRV